MKPLPQSTSKVLMIRPVAFGYNPQTADTNAFQKIAVGKDPSTIHKQALAEFDYFVKALRNQGVRVCVVDDTATPVKPDAIFPNNWISLHADGTVCFYPMMTENRRSEVRPEVPKILERDDFFRMERLVDWSKEIEAGRYLEGTGSMVFDHVNRICYASLSARTNEKLLKRFCEMFQYLPCIFQALDRKRQPIYHTNVVMTVGTKFAILANQCIAELQARARVIESLKRTGHEIIEINLTQVETFAGNMLELTTDKNKTVIVMSKQAEASLSSSQKSQLKKFGELLAVDLTTIETYGGGSARCMLVEIP